MHGHHSVSPSSGGSARSSSLRPEHPEERRKVRAKIRLFPPGRAPGIRGSKTGASNLSRGHRTSARNSPDRDLRHVRHRPCGHAVPSCAGRMWSGGTGAHFGLLAIRYERAREKPPTSAPHRRFFQECDAVISPDVTRLIFGQRLHRASAKSEHSEELTSTSRHFRPQFGPPSDFKPCSSTIRSCPNGLRSA